MKHKNTLTCIYCGMAYPEGTPPYGDNSERTEKND